MYSEYIIALNFFLSFALQSYFALFSIVLLLMIEWWWHFHINFDFLNVELDVSGEVSQEIEKTKPTFIISVLKVGY